MKYLLTFLSTCLFLSLILHVSNLEVIQALEKSERLSSSVLHTMADRIQELED